MTTIVKEDELVRGAFAFIEERLESMKQEGGAERSQCRICWTKREPDSIFLRARSERLAFLLARIGGEK